MEVTVEIKLSSGNEIILSENDYNELCSKLRDRSYIPYPVRPQPLYPYKYNWWDWEPIITCGTCAEDHFSNRHNVGTTAP